MFNDCPPARPVSAQGTHSADILQGARREVPATPAALACHTRSHSRPHSRTSERTQGGHGPAWAPVGYRRGPSGSCCLRPPRTGTGVFGVKASGVDPRARVSHCRSFVISWTEDGCHPLAPRMESRWQPQGLCLNLVSTPPRHPEGPAAPHRVRAEHSAREEVCSGRSPAAPTEEQVPLLPRPAGARGSGTFWTPWEESAALGRDRGEAQKAEGRAMLSHVLPEQGPWATEINQMAGKTQGDISHPPPATHTFLRGIIYF